MIPFARINTYNNKLPAQGLIKRFRVMFYNLYYLRTDGNLYSIGYNSNGRAGGDSSVTSFTRWTLVQTGVADIWTNNETTALILKNDGTWMITGRSYPLGISETNFGFTDCSSSMTGVNVSTLYLGNANIFYIDGTFNLMAMGFNTSGSLGLGNTNRYSVWTQINTNVKKVVDTQGGESTIVLKNDATVYSTGSNLYYQLGFTSPSSTTTFLAVPLAAGAIDIQGSYNSLFVLKSDGLYTCGNQFSGQLGTGVASNAGATLAKRTVPGTITGFKAKNYSCIILSSGNYYYWGQNSVGTGTGDVSTSTLIPAASIANVGLDFSTLQVGYQKLYGQKDDNLYGSGIPGTYVMLPYYTGNVSGLQILSTST